MHAKIETLLLVAEKPHSKLDDRFTRSVNKHYVRATECKIITATASNNVYQTVYLLTLVRSWIKTNNKGVAL